MPGGGVAVTPSRPVGAGEVISGAGMFLSRQAVMQDTVWAGIGCDRRPNVGEMSRFMGRE